jgi:hypothetical protein
MTFENTTFDKQDIALDSNLYRYCTFHQCKIIYTAEAPNSEMGLENCTLVDTDIEFADAAARTLEMLKSFYHGGFRTVVEASINNIRKRID